MSVSEFLCLHLRHPTFSVLGKGWGEVNHRETSRQAFNYQKTLLHYLSMSQELSRIPDSLKKKIITENRKFLSEK